jgi:hypothetical protein
LATLVEWKRVAPNGVSARGLRGIVIAIVLVVVPRPSGGHGSKHPSDDHEYDHDYDLLAPLLFALLLVILLDAPREFRQPNGIAITSGIREEPRARALARDPDRPSAAIRADGHEREHERDQE